MPPVSMSSPENSRPLGLLFSNNPNYGYPQFPWVLLKIAGLALGLLISNNPNYGCSQFPGVPLKIAGQLFSNNLNLHIEISNYLAKSDHFEHCLKNSISENFFKCFDPFCMEKKLILRFSIFWMNQKILSDF